MKVNVVNMPDVSVKESSVKSPDSSNQKNDSLSSSFSDVLKKTSDKNNSAVTNSKKIKSDSKSNDKTVDKKSVDSKKKNSIDTKKNTPKNDNSKDKKIDKTSKKSVDKYEKLSDEDKKIVENVVEDIMSLLSGLLKTDDINQALNSEESNINNDKILELVSGDQDNSLKNLLLSIIKNGSDSMESHESLKHLMASSDDIASLLQSDDKVGIMDILIKTVSESLNNTGLDNNKASVAENILKDFKNLLNEIKTSSSVEAKDKIEEIVSKIKDKVEIIEGVKEKISQKTDNHLEMSTKLDELKEAAVESGQQITAKHEAASDNNSSADYHDNSKDSEILNKFLDNKTDDNFASIANRITSDFKQVSHSVKVHEAPSINRATINEDIIKSVKFMQNNSIKELTVKVNPGTLGEITIRMVAEGDALKANIHTANKETYNLINSQEIKNVLNTENIKVTEVNISLYNEDTTFFSENGNFSGELSNQNNKQRKNTSSNLNNDNYSISENDTDEDNRPGISRLNIFV